MFLNLKILKWIIPLNPARGKCNLRLVFLSVGSCRRRFGIPRFENCGFRLPLHLTFIIFVFYNLGKMSDIKIRVGITQGDPNGIGWEVIIKALSDPRMGEFCIPVIYGSPKAAAFYRKTIREAEGFNYTVISRASEAQPKRINVVDCCSGDVKVEPGVLSAEAGVWAVEALQAAAVDLKAGYLDVVVTAPINKESVQRAGFGFTGHTEFFAEEFGGEPLMLMCSERLKVGLTTIHVPLAEVPSLVTQERIVASLKRLRESLIRDFSVHEPRIAVLSLNPHNGDGGLMGDQERTIILPAIQAAQQEERILAFGPFAADGFFASAGYTRYDAVLAMYHDQGLAPFKALSNDGVNFTAGLEIVRTSPAHGVGFDIAGEDKADPASMRQAIYLAMDVWRSRKLYARITANPLQKFKRETGADVSVADLPDETPQD